MNLLDAAFKTLGQGLSTLSQLVAPLVNGLFQPITDLFFRFVTILRGAIQEVGSAVVALRDWAVAETGKLRANLADVVDTLTALAASIPPLFAVLAERARQYLLARLRANPLGVLSEGPLTAHQAGGPLNLPEQSGAAPWAALRWLPAELRLTRVDTSHPVRVVLDEFRADRAAYRQGKPPVVPAPAATPAGLPGIAALEDPRGADPHAAALLTPDDLHYVQQTTGGGTA